MHQHAGDLVLSAEDWAEIARLLASYSKKVAIEAFSLKRHRVVVLVS
jgi:hypothetical protein